MKQFKDTITLIKNSRGCYILDTVKGCSVCEKEKPNGCYDDCYAKRIAKRYNFDFSKPVIRELKYDTMQPLLFDFKDGKHINSIIKKIKAINMPFIRIGEMGDPSENWEHTFNICGIISSAEKPIVIITKHWKTIPYSMLKSIRLFDLCINTSISALDSDVEIKHRLNQYNRLKNYCNSVLRIVSCDFNLNNKEGKRMAAIQADLFRNENVIDTVFRPSADNTLVKDGIINTKKETFLRSNMLVSKFNKQAYLGMCNTCPDMCGIEYIRKVVTV